MNFCLKNIFFLFYFLIIFSNLLYTQENNKNDKSIENIEEIDDTEEIDDIEEIDKSKVEEVFVDKIVAERKGILNLFAEMNLILYSFFLFKDTQFETDNTGIENIVFARESLFSDNLFFSNLKFLIDWQLADGLHFYIGLLSDNVQNIIFYLQSKNLRGENVLNKQPNFVGGRYEYLPANMLVSSFNIKYKNIHLEVGEKINFFIDENILNNIGVGAQFSYSNELLKTRIIMSPISSSYEGFSYNKEQIITSQDQILTDFSQIQSWMFAGKISYQINDFIFKKTDISFNYMNNSSFQVNYEQDKKSTIDYFFIRVKNIFPSDTIDDRIEVIVDQDSFLEIIKHNGEKIIYRIDSVTIPDEFIYEINFDDKNIDFDQIKQIIMNMKMRYNYEIYLSLDKKNWQIVANSRDMNAGFDDVSSSEEDRIRLNSNIPDYKNEQGNFGVGTDIPREIKIYFETDQIYAQKSKNIFGLDLDIEIDNNSRLFFSYINNITENYFKSNKQDFFNQITYQFQDKNITLDVNYKYASENYTTRFDGISIFDFRNINNLGITRYDNNSPFFRTFRGVADNDEKNTDNNATSIESYYSNLDDDFKPHVPYHFDYSYLFYTSKIRKNPQLFIGILDKNNNDIRDDKENNIRENIDVIPGQLVFDINFFLGKSFKLYASYIIQNYETYYNFFQYNSDNKEYKNAKINLDSNAAFTIQSFFFTDFKIPLFSRFDISIFGKYSQDSIVDHSFNQSHFIYFHIRDIVLFDALDSYKQINTKLSINLNFNLFFVRFRNYIYGHSKIYLADDGIKSSLDNIKLTKKDFYDQHYYTNHLRRIGLVQNFYSKGGLTFHFYNSSAVYTQNSIIYDLFVLRYGGVWINDIYNDSINKNDILLNKKLFIIRPFVSFFLKERASKVSKMLFQLYYQRQNDINQNYFSANGFFFSFKSDIETENIVVTVNLQVFSQLYDLSQEDLIKKKIFRHNELGIPLLNVASAIQTFVGIYSRY